MPVYSPFVLTVVKEAASQKKHNLFVDSADLQAISQGSLSGSRTTPPRSPPPSSPSKQVVSTHSQPQQPELKPSPLASSTGESEEKEARVGQLDQSEKLAEEVREKKDEKEEAKEEDELSKQQEEQVVEQDSVIQVVSPPAELKEEVPTEPPSSPDALSSLIDPDLVTTDSSTVRTDRAVYLNPPAGVPAGSAVPLCEDDSASLTLAPVAEDSSVLQGGSSDEPVTTLMTTTSAPPVTALAGEEGSVEETEGGGGGGDPEAAGEELAASEEERTSGELVASEPTAEGATAPMSGTTSDGQKEEEEDDEEEPLDCVKAIRDLVVEVIEVEDFIRPRPDGRPT